MSLLKAFACMNMPPYAQSAPIFVIDDVSHAPRSALKTAALWNM